MLVDWNVIEGAWLQSVTDAIVATAAAHRDERFYAGAFFMLYGDYKSILLPAFGLNAESSSGDVRWHPPDWRWSVIDEAHEHVRPLYKPLEQLDVDKGAFEQLNQRS
jgi:hypothetical protein